MNKNYRKGYRIEYLKMKSETVFNIIFTLIFGIGVPVLIIETTKECIGIIIPYLALFFFSLNLIFLHHKEEV
ncbi:MAG: hypothetical protein DRJ34_01550 [Thermoprotei archaeon]|nr:MAG: hypothetical protein DRJ34_01550 [Thermoprotei archaeon]